jgi:DNA-binding PadR family transcriptional regulator
MRPRRGRRPRKRYSARNAGQEAALRHIEQARAFSREIGDNEGVHRYKDQRSKVGNSGASLSLYPPAHTLRSGIRKVSK